MPSCFWNFLSRSLVPDTLRQPTSKHTLTFRETCFFSPLPQLTPLPLSSPLLLFLAESLICWIKPLAIAPPHPVWHQIGSFGGFWAAAVLMYGSACEDWSSFGTYCSVATKWVRELHCIRSSAALH